MGVITWSPLQGGWLSGRYRKNAEISGPVSGARRPLANRYDLSLPENQRKLDAAERLAQLAEEAGLSLIQLAIAFVLSHPAITAPIIGPRTLEHLESQLAPPTSNSTPRSSIGSMRSSRPASTSTRPMAAGRAPPWTRLPVGAVPDTPWNVADI
jgi:aryl-alcohol dehydrogenase-like predicted oxidoreductase